MDTLYTFWDNITHSKNKSVHFLGLGVESFSKLAQVAVWGTFHVP